jgi:pimeloyl-CoA synthetase
MDNKSTSNKNIVDPFEVEEIVRASFKMKEGEGTPDGINISYNDLVNYTTYIIELTFEAYEKKSQEFIHKN